jgi:hypothetical protein
MTQIQLAKLMLPNIPDKASRMVKSTTDKDDNRARIGPIMVIRWLCRIVINEGLNSQRGTRTQTLLLAMLMVRLLIGWREKSCVRRGDTGKQRQAQHFFFQD